MDSMLRWLRSLATAFAVACICLTASPSAERQPNAPRFEVDDGRQWFEAGAELNAASSAIRRGAMAAAFNQPYAEGILKTVIQWQSGSDAASQAHELLSRIYLRTGQYSRLIENLDRWAASFPNSNELQKEKADVEQFRGLPDQRNGQSRATTLDHESGDDWSVPITINGKPARYLLDTGAWLSVMTESEAKRLGLPIRSGSATLSESSGKGVKVRTTIARNVTIGAVQFQDVSFAVLAGEGEGGILGMPIILALGQVKWSNRGTWELAGPSQSGAGSSRNVVFSANRLLLATSVSGTRVFGALDTGAIDTDLNENFSIQFPDLVKAGTRQSRDISGLGGTASVASVAVPEVLFQIDTTRAVLRPAHVTLQRTAALGGTCCIGNIGRDLLAQTGEFKLNLSDMTLRLR